MGVKMRIGQQIEQIRQKQNIPIFHMCDVFMVECEADYHSIKNGHVRPTNFQLIMFIMVTQCSLDLKAV